MTAAGRCAQKCGKGPKAHTDCTLETFPAKSTDGIPDTIKKRALGGADFAGKVPSTCSGTRKTTVTALLDATRPSRGRGSSGRKLNGFWRGER